MTLESILHLLRNPYGHPEGTLRQSRLEAAEMLEKLSKQLAAPASEPNQAGVPTVADMRWTMRQIAQLDPLGTAGTAVFMAKQAIAAPQGEGK